MRQNPGRRIRFPRAAIIAVCLLAATAVGALAASLVSQHPAAQSPPSCGEAVFDAAGFRAYSHGALGCFSAAVLRCRAANFKVHERAMYTDTDYVFTIRPVGDACRVSELRQDYSADPGGSIGPVTSTACRVTAVTGTGVDLQCGDLGVGIGNSLVMWVGPFPGVAPVLAGETRD